MERVKDLEIWVNGASDERVDASVLRGKIALTLSSDWAGSTETGFGEDVTQNLLLSEAASLRDWLTQAIAEVEAQQ